MKEVDINWFNLAAASLIIIIPLIVLLYYKTGLVRAMLIAFGRMVVQLVLVGVYLKYIFEINSILINLLWLLIMMIASGLSIVKRSELKLKYFFMPVTAAVLANIIINTVLFALIVIGTRDFFNARYIIPISGMFVGNCIGSAIIALRSFYQSLVKEEEKYRFYMMCGATKNEALFPFMTEALKNAFSPTIASTATIGLIWLPGMMTGQVLSGSDPLSAIKYQIIIIISIFAGGVVTVLLSLVLSKRFAFDKYDLFDRNIFSK